jgi:hypothetical protein
MVTNMNGIVNNKNVLKLLLKDKKKQGNPVHDLAKNSKIMDNTYMIFCILHENVISPFSMKSLSFHLRKSNKYNAGGIYVNRGKY